MTRVGDCALKNYFATGTFEPLFSGGGVTAAAVWRLLLGAAHPRPGLCTWRVSLVAGGGDEWRGRDEEPPLGLSVRLLWVMGDKWDIIMHNMNIF